MLKMSVGGCLHRQLRVGHFGVMLMKIIYVFVFEGKIQRVGFMI